MATAETIASAQRTPTRTTKKSILLRSKAQGLRVVLDPVYVEYSSQGREVGRTKGDSVEFENKIAWVTPEQLEKLKRLHLDDNGDQKPNYQGSTYGIHFWEIDDEPGALKPSVKEQIDAITRAAVKRDEERLAEVIKLELETHKRDEVLDAAHAAIETLEEEQS